MKRLSGIASSVLITCGVARTAAKTLDPASFVTCTTLRLKESSTTLIRYVPGSRTAPPTSIGSVRVKRLFSVLICAVAAGVYATPRNAAKVPSANPLIRFFISDLFFLLMMVDIGETGDGPATVWLERSKSRGLWRGPVGHAVTDVFRDAVRSPFAPG